MNKEDKIKWNKTQRLVHFIMYFVFGTVMLWLIGSFLAWNMNPLTWWILGKMIFAMLWFFLLCFSYLLAYENYD